MTILQPYGEAVMTSLGFFWKSAWAFVFGYAISAMIQAFVPQKALTRQLGGPGLQSLSLATVFGAASSSCSFAALAAARALFMKGAHFVVVVAFMFASTNLVIELGVLILIFLGWQFLAAELVGGIVLIAVSRMVIKITYPRQWVEAARERVSADDADEEEFDWRRRLRSRKGWYLVGQKFGDDWLMVWEEILIGFTVAGFVAVLVPPAFWATIFLTAYQGVLPDWLIALENAVVAPFVAAATFIGSMGNIPLATVLNANGVMFAGIMGFIYSDLMVPPLVQVNAKYYGPRLALYIAGIMFVSIVITALLLHTAFSLLIIVPESRRVVSEIVRFKLDYTFWMNLGAVIVVFVMIGLRRRFQAMPDDDGHDHDHHDHGRAWSPKRVIAALAALVLAGGTAVQLMRLTL